MEDLFTLSNKAFIYKCLNILKHSSIQPERWLSVLTSPDVCHDRFSMHYPVMQEVPLLGSVPREMFFDSCGHRRYYPDLFEANGKRFLVCNDWYYGNIRDTRTPFVKWIKQITA